MSKIHLSRLLAAVCDARRRAAVGSGSAGSRTVCCEAHLGSEDPARSEAACKPGRGAGLFWNVVLPLKGGGAGALRGIRAVVAVLPPPICATLSPPTAFVLSFVLLYARGGWRAGGGGGGVTGRSIRTRTY